MEDVSHVTLIIPQPAQVTGLESHSLNRKGRRGSARSVLAEPGRLRTPHLSVLCLCLGLHSKWIVTDLVSSSCVHGDLETISHRMNGVVKR